MKWSTAWAQSFGERQEDGAPGSVAAAAPLLALAGVILVLALAGCATFGSTAVAPMTGEEQAVHIVWHDVYHREDVPPLIRWRAGSQLDCDDAQSGKRGFWIVEVDPSGPGGASVLACREGLTWSPLEVLVAFHGETSFADTALAHELEHAELLRRGIFIGHHERPDFFTRIDAANAALQAAGR